MSLPLSVSQVVALVVVESQAQLAFVAGMGMGMGSKVSRGERERGWEDKGVGDDLDKRFWYVMVQILYGFGYPLCRITGQFVAKRYRAVSVIGSDIGVWKFVINGPIARQ